MYTTKADITKNAQRQQSIAPRCGICVKWKDRFRGTSISFFLREERHLVEKFWADTNQTLLHLVAPMKIRLEIHPKCTFKNVPTSTNKLKSIDLARYTGHKQTLVNQVLFQMIVCNSVFWNRSMCKFIIYKAEMAVGMCRETIPLLV